MKNFDYNTYHPYGAYSNHSYNNNNTCHTYPQQQQQQQQQLSLQPTYPNNQQFAAALQQQQHQQKQQQLHKQNPQQALQQQRTTLNSTTSACSTNTHNNNTNTNTNNNNNTAFNMQATTYANLFANYNQNNIQNNNHNYNNNNYNEHQHVHHHLPHHHQHNNQHHPANQQHVNHQQEVAATSTTTAAAPAEKFTMDACEIANFLANELFMQQLVSVDGIQSGVPTLTTSTLTPTTLRSIEETFTQLISEPINAPYQAGFIPPPLAPFPSVGTSTSAAAAAAAAATTTYNSSIHDFNDNYDTESEDSQASWNGAQLNEENSMATTDTSSAATDSTSFQNGLNGMGNNSLATSTTSSTNDFTSVNIAIVAAAAAAAAAKNGGSTPNNKNTSNSATTTRRNQGGRRPAKSANMSPEEEEKRRIRRERNKLAAARCRKRRVDQTNELLEEVAILEKKREGLQKDIENLNTTKQELEYILEAHRPTCQKVRQDLLSVSTYGGLIAPSNSNTGGNNNNITGMDATLAATARNSPIDLKPDLLPVNMIDVVHHIKHEPIDDTGLDSPCSSLDHDGPPSPKRILLTRNNPMIPPPLPNVATLSPALAAASASLNTPIVTTAPVSFSSFNNNSNTTLNALNAMSKPSHPNGSKQRPNTLPTIPRNLAQSLGLNVDGKPPTDINGVAIQTPSTGMFNFDSLMDGGTGLTPVSGPLVPTCSSQNKHPLELTTPTSEPSKLVSL